jgi:hypothetical protein
MRFIYLTLGAPGAVHDARVFNNSSLPHLLIDALKTSAHMYLLGDAAYGSRQNLLVPSPLEETPGQARYNFIHSSLRMVIERCFGVFKKMWKVFGQPARYSCGATSELFYACAVVHNVIIDERMDLCEWLDEGDIYSNDDDDDVGNDRDNVYDSVGQKVAGETVRQAIIAHCELRGDLVTEARPGNK